MYDRYDADYLAVKDNMTYEITQMVRDMDVAIEAALPNASDVENDPQAPGAAQAASGKFQEVMRKLFDKIQNLIESLLQKLKNFTNKMIMTDKGYKSLIRNAEVNRKPLKAIKIIMYEYDPGVVLNLFTKFDKIMDETTNISGKISDIVKDPDNILALTPDKLEAAVIEKLNLPEGVDTFDQLMIYCRKIFHGKKAEKTILASELPIWMKRASKTDGIQQLINNSVSPKKARTNQMKRVFLNTAMQQEIPDNARTILTRMASNTSKLYGKYATFATTFFDLYLEFVVASRVITKRFYQI